MKKESKEGITKIHNVRFYNLIPRPIIYLAYNKQNGKLAVSRDDGCLEIWDINYAPVLEKFIPGMKNYPIETMAWVGNRLFSSGLNGLITEWDLNLLKVKYSQPVTGNVVWCSDVNKQEDYIALGTEEGYLNLFKIIDDGVTYKMIFDKQDGRILCCKFDVSGDFIVTGSKDVIRIWNTKTGNAIHKMTLGRIEANVETIVWSLEVLSDFSIISGDSRGFVTVWDGKLGTQVQSIQVSKASVFCLTVNEDENTLLVSGVDSLIKIYSLTEIRKENYTAKMWIKFIQRHVHDHDVHTILCAGTRVISGGTDGYIGFSSFSKKNQEINKYCPFLQKPCATICAQERLILLRYIDYLELWKLGVPEDKIQFNEDENDPTKHLLLEKGPEKLIELKSYREEAIICSTISPDGRFIIYSTMNFIRMFSLEVGNKTKKSNLILVKDLPKEFSPCCKIIFSHNSNTIFLSKLNRQIDVFNIETNNEICYMKTINVSKNIKDVINNLIISYCENFLVISDTCKNISVWHKNKNDWKHYLNLPKYSAPTVAIAYHYNKPRIVAAFSDGKIFEYDLEEMRFTCSTNKIFVPKMELNCINEIVLDPRNENIFILQNSSFLFTLEKDMENNKNTQNNKVKKTEETTDSVAKLNLKFKKSYEHLAYLSWLSECELVIVGVNPVALIEQLPDRYYKKKFGAS